MTTSKSLGKPAFFQSQYDAAAYLGIAQTTFNKLVKDGEIQGERVGDGEKRKHFYFSTLKLDQFQLEAAKQKLGDKFDEQFKTAQEIVDAFQRYNDALIEAAMIKGKSFPVACQDVRIMPRYLKSEIARNNEYTCQGTIHADGEHIFLWALRSDCNQKLREYNKLNKSLKSWVDNEIYYHANDPTTVEVRYFSNPIPSTNALEMEFK